MNNIVVRETVRPEDRAIVASITRSSGFFTSDEIEIADELVCEVLQKGRKSGYFFLFADNEKNTVGYSIYGPIAGTVSGYDLYWIAVDNSFRNKKIGSRLLAETEARIRTEGGHRIYVETSSQIKYEPTRAFYHKHGYRQEARLPDFYDEEDDKIIYCKTV
ncbi:MAG: GNAT family N-acetyltransferase [Spirochaetales bacterium]|nr:GNAT family N-acetyltransferase [Spirochaetales bacterium]